MHSYLTNPYKNRQQADLACGQMVCQPLLYTILPPRSEALQCLCFKCSSTGLGKTREKRMEQVLFWTLSD